jgi:hypothetical protein
MVRAWKTFDWDSTNRLYAKGLLEDPAIKAKSFVLTEVGVHESKRLFEKLFMKT